MTTPNGGHPPDLEEGAKELPVDAIARSAVEPQHIVSQQSGWDSLGENLLLAATAVADGIRPWGTVPALRDRQLRAFITQEPFTMSAIATVIARNVGLNWIIDGPKSVVPRVQDVLHHSQFGKGWEELATKVGWDYQTMDKGAIIEMVREEDRPDAPTIGLNQLDSNRCWHTGNPQYPVLYQDRMGRWHAMKWYQCLPITEMPVAHETLYGLQYSSLTRYLVVAQIVRNILKMDEERTGGRWTQAVHIISGIKKGEVESAVEQRQRQMDQLGLMRFGLPTILSTIDPNADPKLVTLSLASLPDGFKIDDNFRWYITALAMALFVDYGELAPLPGRGIGTSAQSEVMHRKSRSKGIAIWTNKVEHLFNFFGVMPKNCTFRFDDKDLEEDQARADVMLAYAQAFTYLTTAGAVDAEAIQRILLDVGLLPQDIYDELVQRMKDLQAKQAVVAAALSPVSSTMRPANQPTNQPGQPTKGTSTEDANTSTRSNPGTGGTQLDDSENAVKALSAKVDEERMVVEGELTETAKRALASLGKRIKHRLDK